MMGDRRVGMMGKRFRLAVEVLADVLPSTDSFQRPNALRCSLLRSMLRNRSSSCSLRPLLLFGVSLCASWSPSPSSESFPISVSDSSLAGGGSSDDAAGGSAANAANVVASAADDFPDGVGVPNGVIAGIPDSCIGFLDVILTGVPDSCVRVPDLAGFPDSSCSSGTVDTAPVFRHGLQFHHGDIHCQTLSTLLSASAMASTSDASSMAFLASWTPRLHPVSLSGGQKSAPSLLL
mgnify:CR=1 FL=1